MRTEKTFSAYIFPFLLQFFVDHVENRPWEDDYYDDDDDEVNCTVSEFVPYEVVQARPDLRWDWMKIADRPWVTQEVFLRHRDWKWNLGGIIQQPWATIEFLTEHREFQWPWEYTDKHFPLDILLANPCPSWPWYSISRQSNVTPDFVLAHPHLPWKPWCAKWITIEFIAETMHMFTYKWDFLSRMPMEWLADAFQRYPFLPWNMERISCSPWITIEIVLANKDLPWKWNILMHHDWVTIQNVKDHFHDILWDWCSLSHSKWISDEFVLAFIDQPWDFQALSSNSAISAKFAIAHPQKNWSRSTITLKADVTRELVEAHPEIDWYPRNLTCRAWFDGDFLEKNIDLFYGHPNAWCDISAAKWLTQEYVESHLHFPWNWGTMSWAIRDWVDFNFVRKHADKPWNYHALLTAREWAAKAVIEDPEWPHWDWSIISSRKWVTKEFFEAHLDFPWNWRVILVCQDWVDNDFISRHHHRFEDPSYIGVQIEQGGVTKEFVSQFPKFRPTVAARPIPYSEEARDSAFEEYDRLIAYHTRYWFSAHKIVRWWIKQICMNPFHPVGQRFLERQYLEAIHS